MEKWKLSKLLSIFEYYNKNDTSNYKEISFSESVFKYQARISNNTPQKPITEEQIIGKERIGFRKERSTIQ